MEPGRGPGITTCEPATPTTVVTWAVLVILQINPLPVSATYRLPMLQKPEHVLDLRQRLPAWFDRYLKQ
jgi:hypothetical protein